MAQTLGQQRAEFALKKLEAINCNRDKFKKLCAGLPAMIMQNGFGQALAFLAAKGCKTERNEIQEKRDSEHVAAYSIILEWLEKMGFVKEGNLREKLMAITKMDQSTYLRAQRETLAMLEWLKRFAHAALFANQGG
jgi:CRISPR-associated protein Cmr5